jgi:hypothetical protein
VADQREVNLKRQLVSRLRLSEGRQHDIVNEQYVDFGDRKVLATRSQNIV